MTTTDDSIEIFPGAQIQWNSTEHVEELQEHFTNQIPQLVSEIETVYGSLNGQRVLDLGCGPGRLPEAFSNMSLYCGVDQSKLMISKAKKKFPEHYFTHSGIEYYYDHNPFDVVMCIDVLQHLKNPPEQLLSLILESFNSSTFIFRTYFNIQEQALVYKMLDSETSISYPMVYFTDLVSRINIEQRFSAELFEMKPAIGSWVGVVYIVCRKDIDSEGLFTAAGK